MFPHYSFDLYFSNNKQYLASFHVFISHLHVSFGEMSVYVFCPLFDWVVCFLDLELHEPFVDIGDYSLVTCINCKYLLHAVGWLFILSMVSFAVQKLLSLIRSHLFIFVFISIMVGDGLKKILLWFMSRSVLPMFSSKGFIESCLALIHF